MAKAEKAVKPATAADLFDDLTNIIGENADAASIRGWLDTGLPELNFALGGSYKRGCPMGRFLEIYGASSSGKTYISTMLMKAAQEQGGIAFFADHERSFSPEFADILGLNLDPTVFKHLRPETFEDSVEQFKRVVPMLREKGLPMEVPLIWVFDSVAAMIPRALLYEKKGSKLVRRENANANMKDKLELATCTSVNYPILKSFAEDYNVTVIMLNQIRMDPGVMFGNPEKTPGGKSGEFYADIRVNLGKKDVTNGKKGDEKEILGFEITANAIKNKVARPFRKAQWQVRFHDELGVYVDRITTMVNFLVRKGIIEKDANGRIEWEGKKDHVSAVIKQLKAEPNGIDKLMAMVDDRKLEAAPEIAEETAED
jgi:recombination protein RecA